MVDRDRLLNGLFLVVLVGIALGGLLEDPIGIGSDEFYFLFAMGLGFGGMRATEIAAREPALLVGGAGALGGLLMGVGSLPLGHPLTDPLRVGGQVVAAGGVASVVGFVLFLVCFLAPVVHPEMEIV